MQYGLSASSAKIFCDTSFLMRKISFENINEPLVFVGGYFVFPNSNQFQTNEEDRHHYSYFRYPLREEFFIIQRKGKKERERERRQKIEAGEGNQVRSSH